MTVVLIFVSAVLISQSELVSETPELLVGITYDLTLLAPLLYLVLIWRTKVPKITVLPIFAVGLLIASNVIPPYQREHLDFIEMVILPLVELTIIILVIVKVRRTLVEIKSQRQDDKDIYSVLKKSTAKVLQHETLGKVFATEIAMFYFGLFRWKSQKPAEHQFTGYRENGLIAILFTLVFLVILETFIVHLLLVNWHALTAWIIFALSIYAGIQLLGHTKALKVRFTEISPTHLILRYGLFGDAEIPLEQISSVQQFSDDLNGKQVKSLKMLGGLESHNLLLELKASVPVESVYGTRKQASKILLHLDEPKKFIKQLEQRQNYND